MGEPRMTRSATNASKSTEIVFGDLPQHTLPAPPTVSYATVASGKASATTITDDSNIESATVGASKTSHDDNIKTPSASAEMEFAPTRETKKSADHESQIEELHRQAEAAAKKIKLLQADVQALERDKATWRTSGQTATKKTQRGDPDQY
jgi:hypothetical protein